MSTIPLLMNCCYKMKEFFADFGDEITNILGFEEEKLIDPQKRYAWQVREKYGTDFTRKGIKFAKDVQDQLANNP